MSHHRTLSSRVEKMLEKVGSEKVIVFESCPEGVLDEVGVGRGRSRDRAAAAAVVGSR